MSRMGLDRAVLFDFFGTLVDYQPDRTRLSYSRTHGLLASWGYQGSYDDFATLWETGSRQLEARARRTLREFSMADAAERFTQLAELDLTGQQRDQLAASFVLEWQEHIIPVAGVTAMVRRIAGSWGVGVVSNTHDRQMVPAMLGAMGLDDLDVCVISVEHGYCKPHRSIYTAALTQLGVAPQRAVFVGDSYDADFVGPEAVGMVSYLIDPELCHDVPPARQLRTVLDIEPKLADPAGP